MKNFLKNVSIVLLIFLIIIKRPVIINGIIEAINIWLTCIFPSLFPFLIVSDLIISTNLINIMTDFLGPIFSKVFQVSKYGSYVFIMSLISGCPSNAKYIRDLLENGLIKAPEAAKILAMSMLYNPILILTITSYLPKSDAYLVIILNIIINLIIGFIFRGIRCDYQNNQALIPKKFNLVSSIGKTIDTLLLVLGSLALFIALSALISYEHPLIIGIFEITNGIKTISSIINPNLQLIFTGMLLSFGGLSIHTQIKSILKDFNIEYSLFYKARIIHLFLFILILQLKICFF